MASGTCGGATTQYFDAACDGVTVDDVALIAWKAYGVGMGAATAKLYIPPGSSCRFSAQTQITFGIQNAIIWGYGANIFTDVGVSSQPWFGGEGVNARQALNNSSLTWSGGTATVTTAAGHNMSTPSTQVVTITGVTPSGYNGTFVATVTGGTTFTYNVANPGGSSSVAGTWTREFGALINSVSAGASSVTISQTGAGAIFSINDYVILSGVSLQQGGDPPNWQFFDYHRVTNVAGDVLTLDSPLTYSYLSTWPAPGLFSAGGPGMIFKLAPTWNTNVQVYGLRILPTAGFGGNTIGKNLYFEGIYWQGAGPNISMTQSWTAYASSFEYIPETDKQIDTANFRNITAWQLAGTNRSFLNENISFSNIKGGPGVIKALNGTALNTTITNSTLSGIAVSPQGTGWANSLSVTNTQFASSVQNLFPIAISALSYSSGTFTIARASGSFATAVQWGCLNCQYYLGYTGSPTSRVANDGKTYNFTITAIRGDATNVYYDISNCGWVIGGVCPASLPTPTIGGQPVDELITFPVNTVTQTNSGPDNLTTYAFP